MNKYNLPLIFVLLFAAFTLSAQQEEKKEDLRPVRNPWESTTLIENQTTLQASKNQLELIIHHRFGPMNNGFSDFFGIYAASNIRLGLQYGITDKFMLSLGTEKNNKLTDLAGKYAIIQQSRDGSRPISLSLYANLAIDGRDKTLFSDDFQSTDRLSYFAQALVSRRFSKKFSLQFAPSYSHFNAVPETAQHDRIGLMFGGRYKITKKMGVIAEYNQPIKINPLRDNQVDSEPGLALGIEIGTSTHAFQVFATNYSQIIPQKNYVMNPNKFDGDGVRIGFNITVSF